MNTIKRDLRGADRFYISQNYPNQIQLKILYKRKTKSDCCNSNDPSCSDVVREL